MAPSLKGRVAVVTGASRGIGLEIARELVERGAKVCVTARNAEPLADAVRELGGPDHAIAVAGRADDPEHQAETVARTLETFGRLDHLVNNTGINPVYGQILDVSPDQAAKILGVNLLAPMAWTKLAYDGWMRENGGAVVNVASLAGLRAAPGLGMYAVSKAALIHLTTQLAFELAPGIRVNAVAPAIVKTKFAEALYDGREERVAAGYPLGRLGVPQDIAGAVAFLLSEEAGWITGQTLTLDGGVSLAGGL
ncbi:MULTISPECIES: SDR family oxidoreductase [unclassified Kitasatospora]|uniref:SDR family oxidoreductase n=1 Tax=unclassified Kitasatospora TaxID=2633591 RepID=UPI00070D7526|nr:MULTISPECIES: SDR family oxidoreductase [unclassified Kitasatospora]KQV21824.1 3-ketoacyl-ACP reductase [Kitasatospora sp. Root107]KRB75384.1 3-ketoacyl-ACP reductase [Kitasatospora sp. Root187]